MRLATTTTSTPRRRWESASLRSVGTLADILRAGGGKCSIQADDSGDAPLKPKGQESNPGHCPGA